MYTAAHPGYRVPRPVLMVGLVLLGLLGLLFYWTFRQMWPRWNNPMGYYSHGPLVVPIALVTAWLIIRKRGLPMLATAGSRRVGLAVMVAALVMHTLCVFARITFISGFMLPTLLAGMMLYLGGWPMLRRLWFPVAFLGFMVPLPDITIYNINFYLKLYAAEKSTGLVNAFGVPAFRRGSEVFLEGGKHLTVDDVCSGLRSLIALLAFSMLFTYACRLRGYKRVLLFLSAVPIAVLANIVRITVLLLTAHFYDVRLASPGGWVHDLMGFAVFVVAFCLMFLEEEILDLLPGARGGSSLLTKAGNGEAVRASAPPAPPPAAAPPPEMTPRPEGPVNLDPRVGEA